MHRLGALLGVLFLAAACQSGPPSPKSACLAFDADPDLNLYNGQSHPVTVFVYPLSSSAVFEQMTVDDLLGGASGSGMLSSASQITVGPGEQDRRFEKLFPPETGQLGVIADYYREPGEPEGTRRQVVPARCWPFFSPRLTLSARDLYLD